VLRTFNVIGVLTIIVTVIIVVVVVVVAVVVVERFWSVRIALAGTK